MQPCRGVTRVFGLVGGVCGRSLTHEFASLSLYTGTVKLVHPLGFASNFQELGCHFPSPTMTLPQRKEQKSLLLTATLTLLTFTDASRLAVCISTASHASTLQSHPRSHMLSESVSGNILTYNVINM